MATEQGYMSSTAYQESPLIKSGEALKSPRYVQGRRIREYKEKCFV